MKSFANISVVIPTMNRPASLQTTIASILASSVLPSEIIVVDQTQEEALRAKNRQLLEEVNDKGVKGRYFYQEKPSLTRARNVGIAQVTQEVIVFSDDDVNVQENTFERLKQLFDDPKKAMVAGLDCNMTLGNGNVMGYLFGMKSWRKRKIGHVTMSMLGRFPNQVQGTVETEWAMGFFFAVRRSLVEKWNLRFDENLTSYAYAEDLDFSYTYYIKAKECGMKCLFDSGVVVDHTGSKEYRVPSQKAIYMYVINREYLSYKHRKSALSRVATRWTNLGMVIANLRQPTIAKLYWQAQRKCDQIRKHLMQGILPENSYRLSKKS